LVASKSGHFAATFLIGQLALQGLCGDLAHLLQPFLTLTLVRKIGDNEEVKVFGEPLDEPQLLQARTALEDDLCREHRDHNPQRLAHPVVLLHCQRLNIQLLSGSENRGTEDFGVLTPP